MMMRHTTGSVREQDMEIYYDAIFSADSVAAVCDRLQNALNTMRAAGYLAKLPDYYEDIAAKDPKEVQDWFDDMKEDERAAEEGPLNEICDLFEAALWQIRKLGFHRDPG